MIEAIKEKINDIVLLLENTGYFLLDECKKKQYKTFTKEDGTLLTELDIASEIIIKNNLKNWFGDVSILSEENTIEENIKIANQKYFFLLDPIDGTISFHQNKHFTINLCFCVNKEPQFTFIHNPIDNTTIFGDSLYAFIKEKNKVSLLQKNKKNNNNITQLYHKEFKMCCGENTSKFLGKEIINYLKNRQYKINEEIITAPALIKLFYFVQNQCVFFITSKESKDWDVLPAIPILKYTNSYYNFHNIKVYTNNTFNKGMLIASNDEQIFDEICNYLK